MLLSPGCGEIREVPVSVDDTEGGTAEEGSSGTGNATAVDGSTGQPDNDDSPLPQTSTTGGGSDSTGDGLVPEPFCASPSAPIPDDGTPVETTIVIEDRETEALGVGLRIQHPRVSDLRVELVSPEGGVVLLLDEPACAGANAEVFFEDEAKLSAEDACTPGDGIALHGPIAPTEPLSSLLGGTVAGTWTVRAQDLSPTNEGLIDGWCLTLYGER